MCGPVSEFSPVLSLVEVAHYFDLESFIGSGNPISYDSATGPILTPPVYQLRTTSGAVYLLEHRETFSKYNLYDTKIV